MLTRAGRIAGTVADLADGLIGVAVGIGVGLMVVGVSLAVMIAAGWCVRFVHFVMGG